LALDRVLSLLAERAHSSIPLHVTLLFCVHHPFYDGHPPFCGDHPPFCGAHGVEACLFCCARFLLLAPERRKDINQLYMYSPHFLLDRIVLAPTTTQQKRPPLSQKLKSFESDHEMQIWLKKYRHFPAILG
jgi:hypothetical protein